MQLYHRKKKKTKVIKTKQKIQKKKIIENIFFQEKNRNKNQGKIENIHKVKMLPETQCNEALVVKGATDFSIAAIMGRQTVCTESPEKSSSKFFKQYFADQNISSIHFFFAALQFSLQELNCK